MVFLAFFTKFLLKYRNWFLWACELTSLINLLFHSFSKGSQVFMPSNSQQPFTAVGQIDSVWIRTDGWVDARTQLPPSLFPVAVQGKCLQLVLFSVVAGESDCYWSLLLLNATKTPCLWAWSNVNPAVAEQTKAWYYLLSFLLTVSQNKLAR